MKTQREIRLSGTVRKLIDQARVGEPEQAHIGLDGAGYLYDEVRVPNVYGWSIGEQIEVIIRPQSSTDFFEPR